MHNTCIAGGPDFKRGVQSFLPSGNVDIAPTILAILGIETEAKLSGRVLREALVGGTAPQVTFQPRRISASHQAEGYSWQQYLIFSEVDGVVYLDEGNGAQVFDGAPAR
jgi:arylsulfatase A-like enzyme